ncbi:carbohydrate ABC transporter permease [Paenibacillus sp. sptzw28]|uniref:carbohydrate ABC transporter permease n=1 Tax=Paenibacillus sp. sptzw28 TaxID=715179 RepID=UPI001C6E504E|nr:carbohydrate ABC transporter permease [Paenibacillus sp. sptzw28]QYR22242.1 carbohydrate ABC transporter permease [Paenibacillus sp. sptzw28]
MTGNRLLGSKAFDVINIIFLICLTLLCLLPLWYTLMIALSDNAAVQAGIVSVFPIGFNLYSFQAILSDSGFFRAFWVSVERVVLGAALTMLVLSLAAYPLSRTSKQFPGRNLLMWAFIFCMLFNGGLIPWFITMRNYNMMDSVWGLVLSGGVPIFNLILITNFIKNLPEELEEAAKIDGAGPWRVLLQVILPLLKPVLATVLLFTIVGQWNDFFAGMVLSTKADSYPLQTYIQQLVVSTNLQSMATMSIEQLEQMSKLNNDSLNAAKIFVAMIPVLLIYPFLQRYFVKGITLGSVKG